MPEEANNSLVAYVIAVLAIALLAGFGLEIGQSIAEDLWR